MTATRGTEILTDWGKERNRLAGLTRREILEYIQELGAETGMLRHQTKERLIAWISRATASKYDRDGFLIQK